MELNGRALRRLKQIVGNIACKLKLVQTDTVVSGPFERWVSTDPDSYKVCISVIHQGQCHSAHIVFGPDALDMETVGNKVTALSMSATRKVKELSSDLSFK